MDRIIKKWIPAVLLALVPLAIALAESPAPKDEQPSSAVVKSSMDSAPQAVFLQTKFESAPVFEGTEIKHDFEVENKGDAPLIINKIKPD